MKIFSSFSKSTFDKWALSEDWQHVQVWFPTFLHTAFECFIYKSLPLMRTSRGGSFMYFQIQINPSSKPQSTQSVRAWTQSHWRFHSWCPTTAIKVLKRHVISVYSVVHGGGTHTQPSSTNWCLALIVPNQIRVFVYQTINTGHVSTWRRPGNRMDLTLPSSNLRGGTLSLLKPPSKDISISQATIYFPLADAYPFFNNPNITVVRGLSRPPLNSISYISPTIVYLNKLIDTEAS